MARKWHPFFSKVQSFLNRGWKFILISIFATITILNIQGGSPVLAYQAWVETVAQIPNSDGEIRLEEGSRFYENLRFAEAETAWRASVGLLSGEEKALGFSYLALAQFRQSKLDEADISIQESLRLLNQVTTPGTSERNQIIHARILTTAAQVNLVRNQPELADHALEQLAEATAIYEKLNQQKWVIASQINQAQAMQQLGMYREALKTLKNLENLILHHSASEIPLSGILTLGKTYRAIGVLDQSYCILQAGQGNPEIVLELGNTAQAIGKRIKDQLDSITDEQTDPFFTEEGTQTCESLVESRNSINALYFYKKAQEFYEQVWTLPAVKTETQVQAMVNHLSLALDLKDVEGLEDQTSQLERQANELAPQVLQLIEILPLNREKVYDRIHLARSLARLNLELSQNQLETALAEARELADKRAQAYAIGELGWMKQQQGNWTEAEQWTRQAVAITPPDAIDIRYQWEWQLGQILKEEGRTEEAIRHYTEAVDLLQRVRQNLVALAAGMGEMNADLQFDFRDRVEPVYRELVELLLKDNVPSQQNIKKARDVIESLQVAELQNFLQCQLDENQKSIEDIDKNTAVIYPIVLNNSLKTILKLPNDNFFYYSSSPIQKKDFESRVKELSNDLPHFDRISKIKNNASYLFNLLIQPFREELEFNKSRETSLIKNLVVIPDGLLRNIPPAVLYTDQVSNSEKRGKYLIERYSISVNPGLNLLDSRPLPRKEIKALLGGISQAHTVEGRSFEPLEFVEKELSEIQTIIGNQNQPLANESFVVSNVENRLQSDIFYVVHLATHGQFSSSLQQNFIMIWDRLLGVRGWYNLVHTSNQRDTNIIELLILSACETAKGDSRAALGLAGVALQAGTRSTIATLWNVKDESTSVLMIEFYKQLQNNPNLTKAEALRQAQLKLLREAPRTNWDSPLYWAPYVLVGNWM
ncbi:CHAT domain-containing protein [Laspinema olomoucense]|uniref:CHAT domain-containing protein n=1 Tax=Laspinema olomoucense TaxID=3231600 RepID=UPI0021BA6438|nr:CHAT domain-containing protein [Laspinema sp. D3a]MCT7988983.1 CHAT domain-containing protein [Laspinema sp. D3a]